MKYFLLLLFAFCLHTLPAQNQYFPPNNSEEWETKSPSELGWCPDKIDSLYDFLASQNSKAFLLLKDGKIVLEKYFGTFTKDSLWYWASAGKTLTGFTVGIAQEEGLLSLNDISAKYLGKGWTSCTTAQEDKITIRHQITMTSGLDDGFGDADCTLPSCLIYKADAGTRWAYHNAPYTLLDGVISKATGQTLNAYVRNKIQTPTGMSGLYFKSGYNNVFYSRPRSMARFGLLLLNKGNWNGTAVMKDTAYFNKMVNSSQDLNLSYGYLTWLNGKKSYRVPGLQFEFQGSFCPDAPNDMFAAMGKNGQFINVVPSQNLVFVRMGNAPDNSLVPFLLNNDIWKKINRLSCQTAIPDLSEEPFPVRIFPNPSNGEIVLENKENVEVECIITDALGKKIHSISNSEILHLNRGIYFFELKTKGKVKIERVVVQPF